MHFASSRIRSDWTGERATHTRSSAMAMPCPTPMHMVESERLPLMWRNSSAAVPVILAPDMPKG